jgi:pimeloyl-ACP methyl ester carboxylesterase
MRERVASRDWLEASEAMRGTFRLVVGEDLSPRLPNIAAPTLLIWGDADEDTPLWMAQRMEKEIPNAGLVVLSGSHYVYAERAAEFNRIATHFLAEAR